MGNARSAFKAAFVAVVCFILIGCTTSQIATSLNVAALAVSAASTTINNVSIDPALKSQIGTYLSATAAALTEAGTYMKGGSITAAQIAGISAKLTSTVAPALPDSVPPQVKVGLTTAAAGVSVFLEMLEAQAASPAALGAGRSGNRTYTIKLSYRDKRLIDQSLKCLAGIR